MGDLDSDKNGLAKVITVLTSGCGVQNLIVRKSLFRKFYCRSEKSFAILTQRLNPVY